MFDFLFQNKNGEIQNYMDLITINLKKMEISKLAIEKAIGMIAKAIAKSEFIVERNGQRAKDDVYWMLNVRTNPNETATDFWINVVKKLLTNQECVIIHISDGLYLANTFTVSNSVMFPQIYSNIQITSNGKTINLNRSFVADDVIHLKSGNAKLKGYLNKILSIYDQTIGAMCTVQKIANTPKLNLKMDSIAPIIKRKRPDGTEMTLTLDEYKADIVKMLESDEIAVLSSTNSMMLEQFKIESNVKAEEIVKMVKEIYEETAYAFDIPEAVFLGKITEKADSSNEFVTYACSWIVEIINDSLNAKLVGKNAFLNGEKLWIDMSRFKHRDIVDCAAGLEKLRGLGFSFDEIREMVGREALNTEFSQKRMVTKNFGEDFASGSE